MAGSSEEKRSSNGIRTSEPGSCTGQFAGCAERRGKNERGNLEGHCDDAALDERDALSDALSEAAEQRDALSEAVRLLLEPEPDMDRVHAILMGGWS